MDRERLIANLKAERTQLRMRITGLEIELEETGLAIDKLTAEVKNLEELVALYKRAHAGEI